MEWGPNPRPWMLVLGVGTLSYNTSEYTSCCCVTCDSDLLELEKISLKGVSDCERPSRRCDVDKIRDNDTGKKK